MGSGQRHRQHGIGPQAGLVVAAVQVCHGLIHNLLLQGIEATDGRGDALLNVGDRLEHPLAPVAAPVAIPQLVGLMGAGAGATGHHGPPHGPAFQLHFSLHGGVAAGVQHLPSHHRVNHQINGIQHCPSQAKADSA